MLQYIKTKDISTRKDGTIVAVLSALDMPHNTPESLIPVIAEIHIEEEYILVSDFKVLYEGKTIVYR